MNLITCIANCTQCMIQMQHFTCDLDATVDSVTIQCRRWSNLMAEIHEVHVVYKQYFEFHTLIPSSITSSWIKLFTCSAFNCCFIIYATGFSENAYFPEDTQKAFCWSYGQKFLYNFCKKCIFWEHNFMPCPLNIVEC